jgi:DeoR/GlpR family transcriptional regulator of sugar metabolism
MLIAEVGRVMVEVARQVIVVTDSSKLGRVCFTQIIPLSMVHVLITDKNAPAELVEQIRESGTEVLIA